MNDWWRNPVLQGPDNDYGEYDYLIEEIPQNSIKWELSRYTSRCDSCGKERRLMLKAVSYFYTLDGYDYMSYDECCVCRLQGKIGIVKHKIKKKIQVIKDAWSMTKHSSTGNFRYYYKVAKEINR